MAAKKQNFQMPVPVRAEPGRRLPPDVHIDTRESIESGTALALKLLRKFAREKLRKEK